MLQRAGVVLLVVFGVGAGGCRLEEDSAVTAADTAVTRTEAGLPDQDVRAILTVDRSFQDAIREGEWETLRRLYADDAVQLAPTGKIEGADAIVDAWSADFPQGYPDFTTDTDVIHGDATIGYHRGTWSMTTTDGPSRGNYLWVVRRLPDGQWRIVADMFNRIP